METFEASFNNKSKTKSCIRLFLSDFSISWKIYMYLFWAVWIPGKWIIISKNESHTFMARILFFSQPPDIIYRCRKTFWMELSILVHCCLVEIDIPWLCKEHCYKKKAASVGQNGRHSNTCNFFSFWLIKPWGSTN